MDAVVISLSERRLSRQGIKITFFKSILRQAAVAKCYSGGVDAFRASYPNAELKAGLIAVTFMNLRQLEQFVCDMKLRAIIAGQDLATANQIDGVVIQCTGIEFVSLERPANTGTLTSYPVWYARVSS